MPLPSPYLDDLLTRWRTRGNEFRKEINFQKELIDPAALAVHGNRLAMRERRRRDIRQVSVSIQETQARWEERLHRIEEWKRGVAALQDEQSQILQVIRSSAWLVKARRHQDAFIRRLNRRIDFLQMGSQSLHERLAAWHQRLQDREDSLQELLQKEQSPAKPLYVSRARKQPEIEFVQQHQAESDALGKDVQQMRRSLNLLRCRLSKGEEAVERHSMAARLLYDVHKQEMLTALKGLEKGLQERRDVILSDALVYESGRHVLRQLHQKANNLRCLEDIPQRSHRDWKKLLGLR